MITGKETTGRGAEVEAMKGVIGIMTRIEIIAVVVGLVVPALMTNAESEVVMMMRDAVAVAPWGLFLFLNYIFLLRDFSHAM